MSQTSENNKRIAKNTAILYFKLVVSTFVGIFSSRFILQALGVDDFGLYNVVGGLVVLMTFMSNVMMTTSYRFISVEIGKGDKGNPNRIYNAVWGIHVILAILLLVIGEVLGVWYVTNHLNVQPGKIPEALFLLHLSVLSSVCAVLAVPSNGLLVAVENFLFQTVVEIILAITKLVFLLWLIHHTSNALRIFALFVFVQSLAVPLSNFIYCKMKMPEITKWRLNKNWSDYKKMISFAGWTVWGSSSTMIQGQGTALVVNSFFSTAVNAAMGLANMVNGYVMLFVTNIGRAVVPQIMKSYGAGDARRSLRLTYKTAKITFLMVLFPAVTCILFADFILKIWLGSVPAYTEQFMILIILSKMCWCLSVGFDTSIMATGKIRNYQIGFSFINLSSIPVGILLFKMGCLPYYVTLYFIVSSLLLLLLQITVLKRMGLFVFSEYYHITLRPALKIAACCVLLAFFRYKFVPYTYAVLPNLFYISACILYIAIVEYFFGLQNEEKQMFHKLLKKIVG